MAENPWHPRFLPYVLYVAMLTLAISLRRYGGVWFLLVYTLTCAAVAWLLWRDRRLTPELNLRFHWLAVPTGVGVFAVWIALGLWMARAFPQRFSGEGWDYFGKMDPRLAWALLAVKLMGMAAIVPLFEELFARSLLLRSLHRFRRTAIGVVQFVQDIPVLGEWVMRTSLGARAGRHAPVFGPEFEAHPLGALSVFGVCASTLIFMFGHVQRDWPGAIVCGLAYCLLLAATNRSADTRAGHAGRSGLGLGPVIWAHAITNALLWAYTVQTRDWRFFG
jgi:hypothetical protein